MMPRRRRKRCRYCERFEDRCDCWSRRRKLALAFLLALLFTATGFAVAALVHTTH